MSVLVQVEDLRKYMAGQDLSGRKFDIAQGILDGLEAQLQTWVNRPLDQSTTITETLPIGIDGIVWPTHSPVLAWIIPASADIPEQSELPYGAVYLGSVPVDDGGSVISTITIAYRASLRPEWTDAWRLVILRAAAREMTDRADNTMTVKSLSARSEERKTGRGSSIQKPDGFTEEELKQISRTRRRVMVR